MLSSFDFLLEFATSHFCWLICWPSMPSSRVIPAIFRLIFVDLFIGQHNPHECAPHVFPKTSHVTMHPSALTHSSPLTPFTQTPHPNTHTQDTPTHTHTDPYFETGTKCAVLETRCTVQETGRTVRKQMFRFRNGTSVSHSARSPVFVSKSNRVATNEAGHG